MLHLWNELFDVSLNRCVSVIVRVDNAMLLQTLTEYRLPLQTLSRAVSLTITTDSDCIPPTGCVQLQIDQHTQLFVVIEVSPCIQRYRFLYTHKQLAYSHFE